MTPRPARRVMLKAQQHLWFGATQIFDHARGFEIDELACVQSGLSRARPLSDWRKKFKSACSPSDSVQYKTQRTAARLEVTEL
jgi:hypothetical protein